MSARSPVAPGRGRRIAALLRKESLQIVRDPSSISIAFVLPVVLLFLFGYGVSLDAQHVRLAIVVEAPSGETQSLVAAFANSPYFRIDEERHRRPAEERLLAGQARGILVVPGDLAARVARGDEGAIQVILDGTDANTARLVRGYVEGTWAKWLEQRALSAGARVAPPVAVESRVWYNPELRSRSFLVPGLTAIIMTLTGTLLTALVVAREWERGTMEALMATPVGVGELMIGKIVPYFGLGMGGMVLAVVLAVGVFDVPLRGSLAVLLLVSAVFLIGALALGLLISTVARSQFVAGQFAIVVSYLPATMLSGFVFEIGSMPAPIQAITHVVSARYLVSSLQTLFLAGTVWEVIAIDLAAMSAIAVLFLVLAGRRVRKRID